MSAGKGITTLQGALPALLAAVIGGGIGFAAWGPDRSAVLAALLPVLVGLAKSRPQAFVLGLAYILGAVRGIPGYAASWFDDSLLIGVTLWLAVGLIGASVWCTGWTSSCVPWRKAFASLRAWVLALLPPAAIFVPAHPVLAWGYITPSWGWIGVGLSAAVPAGILWMLAQKRWARKYVVAALAGSIVVAGGASFAYQRAESRYVADIVAVSTNWGMARTTDAILDRIERMGRTTKALAGENLASVVIYPESVIQTYEPSLYPIINIEILKDAARAGQTVVLGADLPNAQGHFQNAAIAFYPDGKSATAIARQTVPIALWKPWASSGSFESDWTANNILSLRDGVKARVVFCYEEYIPVLGLLDEAKSDFQLVVVMSNTWAARDPVAAEIQNRHSEALARLFGHHLVKAENRPRVPYVHPQSR